MARIPDDELERYKRDTELVRLVESRGIELKRHGANGDLVGLCPFHDDTSPSLVVSPKKNLWHCLGACQAGGDVIQWVMKAEKVSFRHAVELLREGVPGTNGNGRVKTGRPLDSPIDLSAEDHELMRQVVDYYHRALKANASALAYLQKRGIDSAEAIDRFKIGLADRTLGLRIPIAKRREGARVREQLKKLGIFRKSGSEHLNGSVVFPIFDREGRVVEMYGRKIRHDLNKGTALHLYLPGPHAGVWNMERDMPSEEIILCESIIDALTFWCAGYRNVTCSYGIEGFTEAHLEAFRGSRIKRVLIAYDRDEAGDKAAEKLAARLMAEGFECYRVQFPAGMDANEYARKVTPVNQSLGLVIRKARWLGNGEPPQDGPSSAPVTATVVPVDTQSMTPAAKGKAVIETVTSREPSDEPNDSEVHLLVADAASGDTTAASDLETVAAVATLPAALAAEEPHEKQPPAASPQPPAPKEIVAEVREKEVVIPIGSRTYRVRGLERNLAVDVLKVNVLVRHGEAFYVDTFDLYAARARVVFVKEAARELGFEEETIKRDLGKVLLKLECLQDQQIEEALAVKEDKIELSDNDKQAALELLKSPKLVERILQDFERCGVVGEDTNKVVGYLAATSRKLERPLAVVIQSSSAAGKSSLMEAILGLIPAEEQVNYSAMTGQSLFYMGGMELKHKILSIAEEEGVQQAIYALKLLQSEGHLTIASTGKDPGTGRMETQEYHVEGPVMILLTTTAIDIDEELLNRCIVLTVDENREQTRAIHCQQRHNETLEGLVAGQQSVAIRKLHQNAQRLLRPLLVVNPYADQLAFCDEQTRRRRDHLKYLTLIRSIALLHQYQREVRSVTIDDQELQYIEVTIADIVLANRLGSLALGRSIDELPPQSRRLLLELYDLVRKQCEALNLEQREYRMTRRFIRERLGWSQTALKKHLDRLVEMEYVIGHRGNGRTIEYELVCDGRGREGQPTLCGLIDVSKLTDGPGTTTNGSSRVQGVSSSQDHPKNTPLSPSTNGHKRKPPKR